MRDNAAAWQRAARRPGACVPRPRRPPGRRSSTPATSATCSRSTTERLHLMLTEDGPPSRTGTRTRPPSRTATTSRTRPRSPASSTAAGEPCRPLRRGHRRPVAAHRPPQRRRPLHRRHLRPLPHPRPGPPPPRRGQPARLPAEEPAEQQRPATASHSTVDARSSGTTGTSADHRARVRPALRDQVGRARRAASRCRRQTVAGVVAADRNSPAIVATSIGARGHLRRLDAAVDRHAVATPAAVATVNPARPHRPPPAVGSPAVARRSADTEGRSTPTACTSPTNTDRPEDPGEHPRGRTARVVRSRFSTSDCRRAVNTVRLTR